MSSLLLTSPDKPLLVAHKYMARSSKKALAFVVLCIVLLVIPLTLTSATATAAGGDDRQDEDRSLNSRIANNSPLSPSSMPTNTTTSSPTSTPSPTSSNNSNDQETFTSVFPSVFREMWYVYVMCALIGIAFVALLEYKRREEINDPNSALSIRSRRNEQLRRERMERRQRMETLEQRRNERIGRRSELRSLFWNDEGGFVRHEMKKDHIKKNVWIKTFTDGDHFEDDQDHDSKSGTNNHNSNNDPNEATFRHRDYTKSANTWNVSCDDECSICQGTYGNGEVICKSIQSMYTAQDACRHVFHLDCVMKWLMKKRAKGKCPLCKQIFVSMEGLEDQYQGSSRRSIARWTSRIDGTNDDFDNDDFDNSNDLEDNGIEMNDNTNSNIQDNTGDNDFDIMETVDEEQNISSNSNTSTQDESNSPGYEEESTVERDEEDNIIQNEEISERNEDSVVQRL